jgi:hypothetical protein
MGAGGASCHSTTNGEALPGACGSVATSTVILLARDETGRPGNLPEPGPAGFEGASGLPGRRPDLQHEQ